MTPSQHNILVNADGYACISDYGLEIVLRDEACAKPIKLNVRWVAPEVLGAPNKCIPFGGDGKAADIYSLGMVMFEVCLSTMPLTHGLSPDLGISSPPNPDLDRCRSIPRRKRRRDCRQSCVGATT